MFIKLSLICMFSTIIARVIGDVEYVKNPTRATRGAKFFGWRTVLPYTKFPTIKAANRRWRGEFSLSLGRLPVLATSVEFHHIRDTPNTIPQQPCHESINQIPQPPQDNSDNDISFDAVSGIDDDRSTETPLMAPSTTEVMKESSTLLRTLKLEDYDEITFDPALQHADDNNNSNDEDLNAVNRVRRESENDDEIESTTVNVVESSTTTTVAAVHTTSQEAVSSSSNHDITTVSSMLQLPHLNPPQHFHNDNNKFPHHHYYQPSANPHAQYVSITTNMPTTLKNYYDFHPSQPDFFYHRNYYSNYAPWCYADKQNPFIPMAYAFVRNY